MDGWISLPFNHSAHSDDKPWLILNYFASSEHVRVPTHWTVYLLLMRLLMRLRIRLGGEGVMGCVHVPLFSFVNVLLTTARLVVDQINIILNHITCYR